MLSRIVSKPKFAKELFRSSSHRYSSQYVGNHVMGVLREKHNMWERRAPVTPSQVEELKKAHPDLQVLVQPCARRVFTDLEYERAGALITDDLSKASLIVGVKAPPAASLLNDKSYMFFAHVIKAQSYAMPLLDTMLKKNIRLFDYECITEGGKDNTKRSVAFGKYAGRAGMIDGFQALGLKLLSEGFSTPLLNIPCSYMHATLDDAKQAIKKVGEHIAKNGLPRSMGPLVVAFTGGQGNVALGSKEIFELLPHKYVSVAELATIREAFAAGKLANTVVYGVDTTAEHMVRAKDKAEATKPFDQEHYFKHPELYEPVYHETVLPHATMLVNGMYWDHRYPRLVTKADVKNLRKNGNYTLKCVADISCDIGGSCEMTTRATQIESPYFTYSPEKDESTDGIGGNGILMVTIDNLPAELPRDASNHFGSALKSLLPPIVQSSGFSAADTKDPETWLDLPPELRRACVLAGGQLMPKWTYIDRLREQHEVMSAKNGVTINFEVTGHLFDSGVINNVFDLLEAEQNSKTNNKGSKIEFSIVNTNVAANSTDHAVHSIMRLTLKGLPDGPADTMASPAQVKQRVEHALAKITSIVTEHPRADGSIRIIPDSEVEKQKKSAGVGATKSSSGGKKYAIRPNRHSPEGSCAGKRVLLFGSGMVALPAVKLWDSLGVHVTIAGESASQAQHLIDAMSSPDMASYVPFKFPTDMDKLGALLKASDVVVSLLPATMHAQIAEEAIKQKVHMVTASYVSPAMKALHAKAQEAGIIILNEVGLDPGMDHMMIMKAVDDIHSRGGTVSELVSLCGGLPDPVAADNPLLYKFSWSPKGVLSAAGNAATYLSNNEVVEVPGEKLLTAAQKCDRFPTMRMEVLPNRDSLSYRELYGVPEVHSICRGTLRYEGWGNIYHALRALGLFDTNIVDSISMSGCGNDPKQAVREFLARTLGGLSREKVVRMLVHKGVKDPDAAMNAFTWLGLLTPHTEEEVPFASQLTPQKGGDGASGMAAIDALGALLEARLQYSSTEKDMVAMYHHVEGEFPDGRVEKHITRLLAFGTPGGDSAMAATVGYTAAAGAELLLNGTLNPKETSGVIIPTMPKVYEPMLDRIQDCGIVWSESIEVE